MAGPSDPINVLPEDGREAGWSLYAAVQRETVTAAALIRLRAQGSDPRIQSAAKEAYEHVELACRALQDAYIVFWDLGRKWQ